MAFHSNLVAQAEARERLLRALMPERYPPSPLAGPPDLRHSIIRLTTALMASGQPCYFGEW
jgi:hypothetical protein